jgi:uncharacterized protein (TIGR02996 family)
VPFFRLESVEQAFLQAIREDPDDDTPRLIYADWLQEQGSQANEDRANFIRWQCRLAHMAEDDPLRAGLQSEADKLLNLHRQEWMQPLRDIVPALRDEDVTFARGSPASVTLRRLQDLAHAEEIAGRVPFQELRLYLTGSSVIDNAGALALAESPHLRRLTRLDLRYNDIGYAGSLALAASPHLQRLTHLNLVGNLIGDAGARALAESPYLQHLTRLDLQYNGIVEAGARALAESLHLQHLTTLDLSWNDIDNAGARALAESPHLHHLMHFNLDYNNIGNGGAQALRRSLQRGPLRHLTELNLAGNGISPTLLAAIGRELESHRSNTHEQATGLGQSR